MSMPSPQTPGYRIAQWQFERDGEHHGFGMELSPSDFTEKHILDHFDAGNFYEPEISKLMINVLKKGDAVFDVGANCGYFTALAATLSGPSGKIIAIEPAPENVARIARNIQFNRLTNVTIVEKIAASRAGETKFYLNSDNSGGHALWDPGEWPANSKSRATPMVALKRATTLDEEWSVRDLKIPKLVKIDTEGAEQFVLEGARNLLSGCKVPFVIAELHEFGLAQLGCTQESLRRLMEGLGYSTFALYFSGAMPKLIPEGVQIRVPFLINLLFATPKTIADYWPITAHDPRSPL